MYIYSRVFFCEFSIDGAKFGGKKRLLRSNESAL